MGYKLQNATCKFRVVTVENNRGLSEKYFTKKVHIMFGATKGFPLLHLCCKFVTFLNQSNIIQVFLIFFYCFYLLLINHCEGLSLAFRNIFDLLSTFRCDFRHSRKKILRQQRFNIQKMQYSSPPYTVT